MTEYAQFLKDLFAQRNAGRRTRLAEEMAVMGELPARRMESAKREQVKVDSGRLTILTIIRMAGSRATGRCNKMCLRQANSFELRWGCWREDQPAHLPDATGALQQIDSGPSIDRNRNMPCAADIRSEEHTSELQSPCNLV